jgi:hypothetical protein
MKVHILAKMQFDKLLSDNNINDGNVEKFDSIFFISIVDTDVINPFGPGAEKYLPSEGLLDQHFKEDHSNVMNLQFDDVAHDGEKSSTFSGKTRAFTEKQATKLFEFIKANREKETCIVHCMAGISRSGAVGIFVNGYAGGDWELFKRTNPAICPNGRIHRMLNAAKYNDFEDELQNFKDKKNGENNFKSKNSR